MHQALSVVSSSRLPRLGSGKVHDPANSAAFNFFHHLNLRHRSYSSGLTGTSFTFGDWQSSLVLRCANWRFGKDEGCTETQIEWVGWLSW